MVSRRSFRREFKLSLCKEISEGRLTKARACREHALSPGMLDRWVDQYKALGSEAFPNSNVGIKSLKESAHVRELEALVGRLTLENSFLKAALEKGASARGKKRA